MPEWVKDEDKWEDAKKAFKKSYDKNPSSDKDWAIVTSIYKNMGGKIEGVREYIEQFQQYNSMKNITERLDKLKGDSND